MGDRFRIEALPGVIVQGDEAPSEAERARTRERLALMSKAPHSARVKQGAAGLADAPLFDPGLGL